VIGARAGGVPDVIAEGRDGLLVDFGDVEALASALERLLEDPGRAEAMGRCGREKVAAHYTWEKIYRKLRGVYKQLLDGPA
jgi:glycosyltransferase involved in cell wall biosynthesis